MPLLPLLLTVFIDSLGFGLVFPLLSPLIMNPDSAILPATWGLATRGFVLGTVISLFAIGQFFGSPILGALSDRRGRKNVLVTTLWLGMAGYLLGGAAIECHSLTALLLARILAGVAAGNYAVAQSVIADLSADEEKAKNFGLLVMSWGIGFIIGPYLGGRLSDSALGPWLRLSTPFWFAALLCLGNALSLMRGLQESLRVPSMTPFRLWEGVRHIKKAFYSEKLRGLFFMLFLFAFGWGLFTEFMPLFLMRRLQFQARQIADFYAYVGLWVAICQGILIRPFVKRVAAHRLLLSALLLLGCTLPLLLLANSPFALYLVIPVVTFFESLIGPTCSTLVSRLSAKEEQGEVFGIYNSVQCVAVGFTPMFSGSFVALYPYLPIKGASIAMFLAMSVFFLMFRPKFLGEGAVEEKK